MLISRSKFYRLILSVIVVMCMNTNAKAADISALNFNGDLIGKVIPDGSVVNFDNELIGHITADGLVMDDTEDLIGGIVPQGIAIGYDNSVLGKINNDGSVTTLNDNLVGKILPNGLVVNDNYDILGAVVSPSLVYDDNGEIVGRVSGDGKFYSLSGENVGFITSSGYAFVVSENDKKTNLVGRLISSKMVISSQGKFLGSIAPDGKVIDLKKNTIGNIHANGFVYNMAGKSIGHVVEEGYAFDFNGTYLGFVNYSGEVINQGKTVAATTDNRQVINKNGEVIGYTVSMGATVNTRDGKYLGRLLPKGDVARGRDVIGRIGASGNVINNNGEIIGVINEQGPIFDYLGRLRAIASVTGKVITLEGVEVGFVQKNEAFDRKGKRLGKLLNTRLNFDKNNNFIGVSGIKTSIVFDNKQYTITPNGYIFDENGIANGRNFLLSNIYSSEGNILTRMSSLGNTENASLNEIAKLTTAGIFIDKNNKLLGKNNDAVYATNFSGDVIGYLNPSNLLINNKEEIFAKVLPEGRIVSIDNKALSGYNRAGNAALSLSINGDYLGINRYDGSIRNNEEIIGKISSDNYALDNMGSLYGVGLSYGVAVSKDCNFLGVVSDNGDVRTFKDAYVGMILGNNQVMNETEEVIGHIAYSTRVNGRGGEILGISNPLGIVIDYNNQNLGCTDAEGFIRNSQQEIVGQIVPIVPVMDYNNQIIGTIDFSGNVIDTNGVQVASVDIDGGVKSKSNDNIGTLFKYTVAFDENDVYMGRVNPDGYVVSDGDEQLGKVNYNGLVITKDNKKGYALYDLYVYDNNGNTIGYIAKNGRVYSIMGDMKGSISKGFVLDKKQNVIGRGARDYYIRDDEQNIIGSLNLDGDVINTKNIKVGTLQANGDIFDTNNNIIAKADPLQYYQKSYQVVEPVTETQEVDDEIKSNEDIDSSEEQIADDEQDDISTTPEEDIIDEETDVETAINEEKTKSEERISLNNQLSHKVIGIAVTPGGKYIGDVLSDGQVIDENGKAVGKIDENGNVIDKAGKEVGSFKESKVSQNNTDTQRWREIITNGTTINPHDYGDRITRVGKGGGIGPGERYNPKRAEILAQLHNERRRNMLSTKISSGYKITAEAEASGWQDYWKTGREISTLRVNMDNIITGDKPIPAVLARSVISLGGAPVTAIVERNIYGDSGRNVVIPAGSRVIGGIQKINTGSRFDEASGGMKLDISWDRIIRPDGIEFLLTKSQTGDAEGRGGGALGYVDEQLIRKYTLPMIGTLATSAMSYMMAVNEESTGEVENSKQQAASDARENFINKMDEILQTIIKNKEEIQPVTYIPAGTRIIIYPMEDLLLRTTKEIEKGLVTGTADSGEGGLVNETTRKGTEDYQSNADKKEVMSNQSSTNQNSGNGGNALLDEGPNNNQNAQNKKNKGLPPPAADGSISQDEESWYDDEDSSESSDGIMDLDF